MDRRDIVDSHERDMARAAARDNERKDCAAFLELLADAGAYAEDGGTFAEKLRRIASHMREREKWEAILKARREAKKPLPWERA